MKSFKSLFRSQLPMIIVCLLALTFSSSFYQRGEHTKHRDFLFPDSLIVDSLSQINGWGRKVDIYDQSLQLSIGSYIVPEGWKVMQDIATDPYNGSFQRFSLDFIGPQGEFSRMFNSIAYDHGEGREQPWRDTIMHYLQPELDQLVLGDFKPSERMQRNKRVQEQIQSAYHQGITLTYREAAISGHRHGKAYRGTVLISDLTQSSMPTLGMLSVSFAICPEEQFPQMMQTVEAIDTSFQENPLYASCRIQIQEYLAQASYNYLHDDFYRDEKTGELKRWSERRKMINYSLADSSCVCSYLESLRHADHYEPNDSTPYTPSDMSDWAPIEYQNNW